MKELKIQVQNAFYTEKLENYSQALEQAEFVEGLLNYLPIYYSCGVRNICKQGVKEKRNVSKCVSPFLVWIMHGREILCA